MLLKLIDSLTLVNFTNWELRLWAWWNPWSAPSKQSNWTLASQRSESHASWASAFGTDALKMDETCQKLLLEEDSRIEVCVLEHLESNRTSLYQQHPIISPFSAWIEQPTHFFRTPSRAVWALAQFTANTLWIRRIRSWTTHSLRVITDLQKAHAQMVVSVGGLEFQQRNIWAFSWQIPKFGNRQSKPQGRSRCWNYVQFTCRGWRSYIYVH